MNAPAAFIRTAGVVHGGAVGVLCSLGVAFALHTDLPSGSRPRRVAVTTVEVVTADGRVAAMGRQT